MPPPGPSGPCVLSRKFDARPAGEGCPAGRLPLIATASCERGVCGIESVPPVGERIERDGVRACLVGGGFVVFDQVDEAVSSGSLQRETNFGRLGGEVV